MSLAPGSRLGPYDILATLGAGGMGEVYRARDPKLNRDVALKVLPDAFTRDADRLARFKREAQVLASLNHPNIAAIYGFEDSTGTDALVLALIEGPTLADRLAKGPLPVAEALAIAKQIAEALEAAHEQGVIHRDLKPANVKLRPDGTVKVLDFGLAKALEPMSSGIADVTASPTITSPAMTHLGVILGTAAYMSPEQAAGRPVDKRADIWSFGVVLWEMLTGRRLFAGETVSHTLADVLRAPIAFDALPTGTPPAVHRLLRRSLERDPKQRLHDIADARIEIDEALEAPGDDRGALPAPVTVSLRHRVRLASAVMVGAIVAAGVMAWTMRGRPVDPVQSRFLITTPEMPSLGYLSISPDGRRLAFVARSSSGSPTLFVRALDSVEAQPLPGTENAIFPFWSPDSRHIGFAAQGKLKRIEVAGGPPQNICDSPGFAGGTWNADGLILFGQVPGGSISRVPASGGEPTKVTALDAARKEQGHALPVFLPDGRHFLFRAVGTEDVIEVASLDSSERKPVMKGPTTVAYVAPGYLLFHRSGTLLAQAFDATRFSLNGEPTRVADGLAFNPTTNVADFAASNTGILLYRTGSAGSAGQLTWYDRTGKSLGPVGAAGSYRGIALSPDGTRIAVHQHQDPTGGDIWVLEPARGTFTRLTFNPSHNMSPTWSRDGTQIIFASDRDGGVFNIYRKSSDGTGPDELIVKSNVSKFPGDVAPDGQSLTFGQITNGVDVWVVPLSGDRTPHPFLNSEFIEGLARFSPDGRWMAYISNESGRYEVYVQGYPGHTGKWQVSTQGGNYPRWSRSGRELFYLTPDGVLMAVDVRTDQRAFSASTPRALFSTHALVEDHSAGQLNYPYDVTADAMRFVINERVTPADKSAPLTIVLNWMTTLKK